MWGIVLGFKKHMTLTGENNTLIYKKHSPGFNIKENSCKYWVDDLDKFPGWELYVPVPAIKQLKREALKNDVNRRYYIAFDSNYLLSLFRSLDEVAYKNILRKKFNMREARLKTKQ